MAEEQQEMQEQVPMEDQVKKKSFQHRDITDINTKIKGDSVPILVDRSKMTPQMRHYLTMSKMQSENAYKGTLKSVEHLSAIAFQKQPRR